MRVLVCGGRDFNNASVVEDVLNSIHEAKPITLIIQGEARGADRLGKLWAKGRGIPTLDCPANWELYGKSAGYIRNKYMAEMNPDIGVAFPGGKGTANMVKIMRERNIEVIEVG